MGPTSLASTLELGLLTGVALFAFAVFGAVVATRRSWMPPIPIALVPCAFVCLLVAAPSLRLGAMALIAVGWAVVRSKRSTVRSQPAGISGTAVQRPRLSLALRFAALAWLGAAPGLMVATDRAPALLLWSDALGAGLVVAGVTTLLAPTAAARVAAYFRLTFATPALQQRFGERLLAWTLYALSLSTPEGWLTLFAPAVLASPRLDGTMNRDDSGALSTSTPIS